MSAQTIINVLIVVAFSATLCGIMLAVLYARMAADLRALQIECEEWRIRFYEENEALIEQHNEMDAQLAAMRNERDELKNKLDSVDDYASYVTHAWNQGMAAMSFAEWYQGLDEVQP